eukprot:1305766-Alexandrium_andersonii.AAC.1
MQWPPPARYPFAGPMLGPPYHPDRPCFGSWRCCEPALPCLPHSVPARVGLLVLGLVRCCAFAGLRCWQWA